VKLRGTFRAEVEAGPHQFVMDEPESAGGTATGPTPYDMLASALGGCTGMTLQYYARREKIPLEGVDVTIVHDRQHAKDCADCNSHAGYIHRFTVSLRLHGPLDAAQRQQLLAIAGRCPVSKTLASEMRIETVLVD
jgi:putative redox protein